jgi:hypothetical protein
MLFLNVVTIFQIEFGSIQFLLIFRENYAFNDVLDDD